MQSPLEAQRAIDAPNDETLPDRQLAVQFAKSSASEQPSASASVESRRLCVGALLANTTERELQDFFGRFVVYVWVSVTMSCTADVP